MCLNMNVMGLSSAKDDNKKKKSKNIKAQEKNNVYFINNCNNNNYFILFGYFEIINTSICYFKFVFLNLNLCMLYILYRSLAKI